MSDNKDSQRATPLEENNPVTGSLNVDEVSRNVIDIASIKQSSESAKAAAREASESQRLIASVLAEAQTKLAEITTAATQAVAAKTQIVDDQAVIATKSDHIQKAQEHADTVRANLDRALTAATQKATEAEGQKSRVQSAADAVTQLLTDVRTAKGSADTDVEAISAALKSSEESAGLTKGLAEKAETIEVRIAAYESRLAGLETQCANQLKTIESLLPGATSAGLATLSTNDARLFLSRKESGKGCTSGRWHYSRCWLLLACGRHIMGMGSQHGTKLSYCGYLGCLWRAL